MQSRIIVSTQEESLLSTHKVLRNTYFLLALTLAFLLWWPMFPWR